jgi:hypothetical protein
MEKTNDSKTITVGKRTTITVTGERRLTIDDDEDGVRINQTLFEGFRAPTISIFLTHAELAKIARKCLPAPKAKGRKETTA